MKRFLRPMVVSKAERIVAAGILITMLSTVLAALFLLLTS